MEKDNSNPKYIGPGYWSFIHTQAVYATTDETIDQFINIMEHIKDTFPCKQCKIHIEKYFKKHPIEFYRNGNEMDMFRWAWEFHNAVNKRLKKPTLSYASAISLYYPSEDNATCSSECSASG